MREKIAHAKHQASLAREQAIQSTDAHAKADWLRVARMWEELTHEYAEFAKLMERASAA